MLPYALQWGTRATLRPSVRHNSAVPCAYNYNVRLLLQRALTTTTSNSAVPCAYYYNVQ